MAQTIKVLSQKGGTGKTTAVWAERERLAALRAELVPA
jgi:hypothetical protein